MQLYQFRHSSFCEKVRLVLAAKAISYSVVEVLPGIGQWELFQQTGQRQVPVLQTGNEWIADSTAIALHLEAFQPEPALLPKEPLLRAQVLLFEDWADTALASAARFALVQGAVDDPALRSALLPEKTPDALKNLVGLVPSNWMNGVGLLLQPERQGLIGCLEQLMVILNAQPYLLGDEPSLADIAVAAQLYLLRFPAVAGVQLASRGVMGIADQASCEPLFIWRDELYRRLGRVITNTKPFSGSETIPLD
jgi:glutathione S-transferase